MRDRSYF